MVIGFSNSPIMKKRMSEYSSVSFENEELAMLPIILAFFLLIGSILFGSIGLIGVFLPVVICGAGLFLLYWQRKVCSAYVKASSAGLGYNRAYGWIVLYSVVLALLSPGIGGDSEVYHLPNISYFLKGSTLGFDPLLIYRPEAITSYYQRGFEAICSVFFQDLLHGSKL